LTKPIPKVYATRFFQLATTRQFAEAERILERIKQKMHVSERNRGYFQALYGILLTQKNNDDRYAFMSSIDLTDKKQLKNYRREFLSHVESGLHGEYDRGFFEAWADFMKVLPKLDVSIPSVVNKNVIEKEKEAETITEATVQTKAEEETPEQISSEEKEKLEQETTVKAKEQEKPADIRPKIAQVEPRQRTLSDFAR